MKRNVRRFSAVLAIAGSSAFVSVGVAAPARADVGDAVAYTANTPGRLVTSCTYPHDIIPAPVICAFAVANTPSNIVYELNR